MVLRYAAGNPEDHLRAWGQLLWGSLPGWRGESWYGCLRTAFAHQLC